MYPDKHYSNLFFVTPGSFAEFRTASKISQAKRPRVDGMFYKIYKDVEEIDQAAIVKLLKEAVRVDLS